MKLNQVVAIEKGTKVRASGALTDAYHQLQKPALLSGIAKVYTPKDEEGEKLPNESTKVQVRAGDVVDAVSRALSDLFSVTYTKDVGNTLAKADVVVDEQVLVTAAPVPFLLFLEKQLVDVHTFIKKLPVLDASEVWTHDSNTGTYKSEVVQTTRSKKLPRVLEKSPATDKHPAQTEVWYEDVIIGTWKTTKFSGAISQERAEELLARVEKLQTAVKVAREAANGQEVTNMTTRITDWLFAK